jgi:hypothetical protein
MCTFESDRKAIVCDAAISGVRNLLRADLGDAVRYTVVDGQGTVVEAGSDVDVHRFARLVMTGIAASNQPSTNI